MTETLLEKYNSYPSIIFVPYSKTLNLDDPQRKDHQRIVLEMLLAYHASICLANYHYYKTVDPGDDARSKSDSKIGSDLPRLDFDLGMMSIGKWNQVTRDTSIFLYDATNKGKENEFLVGSIGENYRSTKSKWNQNVNKLISLRNQDAHGQVISDKNLRGELDGRQKLLDQLMKEMAYHEHYKLVVPIDDEVRDGSLIHICKDLSGYADNFIEINAESLKTEISQYGTYLFNESKKRCLALTPMIINYNSSPEVEELDTYIYSKTANNKKDLHYSNFQGAIDLKETRHESVGSLPAPSALCREFSKFRLTVEDEDLINRKEPKISVHRKFKSSTSIIDDDVFLDITIQNNGDVGAENLETALEFSRKGFQIYQNVNDETIKGGDQYQNKVHLIDVPELPARQSLKRSFKFRARNFGGQYQFGEMALTYDYMDEIKEEMVTHDIDENVNVTFVDPVMHQVLDPNDPESQVPIVNLKVTYSDHAPKIGDTIDFIVEVENIGKSIANDVDIHIFPPPDEMDLISGSTSWRGNINPSSRVIRKFQLRPRKQGIFSIKMRDILYTNSQGELFKTLAYEDHKILVQNDTPSKYRFMMEDVWADLAIDDAEQQHIDNQPDFAKFLSENKELSEKVLTDVKVRAVKRVIADGLSRISLPIKQITKKGMIGYCLDEYPFLIIDFNDKKQIKLLMIGNFEKDNYVKSLMSTLKAAKRLTLMKDSTTWKGKFTDLKFYSISLESLGQIGGAQILKRLINHSIRFVENGGYFMSQFLNGLGQGINYDDLFSRIYITDTRIKGIIREDLQDVLKIQAVWMFKPRKNLNLVVERIQGMAQELYDLGHKKTGTFNDKGTWTDSGSKTKYVRLYYNQMTDSTEQEMTNLFQRFLLDIAKASSMVASNKLKGDGKTVFGELLELLNNSDGLDDSFHYRSEKDGIVFYKGAQMPLYQNGMEFLCFEQKTKSINLKFRYMEKESFVALRDDIQVNLDGYWLYQITYDDSFKDQIHSIIRGAIVNSGNGAQRVSFGWLSNIIMNNKVQKLDRILKETYDAEGDWVTYSDIDDDLTMRGLTTVWNKRNLRHFLEYDNDFSNEDSSNGRCRLVSNRKMIGSVMNDSNG